jgi:hypothetical protein
MAAANRPNPPKGAALITKKEVDDTRAALRSIDKTVSQYVEAQRLLAGLEKREEEGRKAEAALLAQYRDDDITGRKEFATLMENSFLKKGMDVHVSISGPKGTTLTIRYILMSRPIVYQVLNETDFVKNRKGDGFKKAVFTDGYKQTWTYDLTK